MAILLINTPLDTGQALIARLVGQQDEVRVLERDPDRVPIWRELGAFVAQGEWDEDLVERAAQNVRTVVIFDGHARIEPWLLEQLVTGARIARVERVVRVASAIRRDDAAVLARSELDYVLLATGSIGLLRRRPEVPPEVLAAAVDAADDLAGHPKLELDLTTTKAWRALHLSVRDDR